MLLSATEGEDKPLKYPVMFRKADLVLLTKLDLLPHLGDDVSVVRPNERSNVMGAFETVSQFGRMLENLDAWLQAGTAYAQQKNFDPEILTKALLKGGTERFTATMTA